MKTSFRFEPFAFFVIFCLLSISLAAEAQYFRGYLQTPQGNADCNPCVNNVINAVNTLRNRGETMGFNWGDNHPDFHYGFITGEPLEHWQGIQRLPMMDLKVPYIVVSSDHGENSD